MSMIQQYGNVAVSDQFAISATSQKVVVAAASILAAALGSGYDATANKITRRIWGFRITNNDPTIAMFVAYNTVTGTKYMAPLPAAGGYFEVSGSAALLNTIQIVAASGTPNAYLTVYG